MLGGELAIYMLKKQKDLQQILLNANCKAGVYIRNKNNFDEGMDARDIHNTTVRTSSAGKDLKAGILKGLGARLPAQ